MNQMAKLTSKGQLTLPKGIRERLNLEKGSCIGFYLEQDKLVMKKVNPQKPPGDEEPIWEMAVMFHDGCEHEVTQEPKAQSKVISISEVLKCRQS